MQCNGAIWDEYSPKQAQLIPCTVVLYDKGGTIQRAGCQLPGDRLKWLN